MDRRPQRALEPQRELVQQVPEPEQPEQTDRRWRVPALEWAERLLVRVPARARLLVQMGRRSRELELVLARGQVPAREQTGHRPQRRALRPEPEPEPARAPVLGREQTDHLTARERRAGPARALLERALPALLARVPERRARLERAGREESVREREPVRAARVPPEPAAPRESPAGRAPESAPLVERAERAALRERLVRPARPEARRGRLEPADHCRRSRACSNSSTSLGACGKRMQYQS
jgi:hypothetical protein